MAAARAEFEILIDRSPKWRASYKAWYDRVPMADGTWQAMEDAKRGNAEKIVDAANSGSRQHAQNKAIREKHLKIFGGEEIDINDPGELALAQARLYKSEVEQHAAALATAMKLTEANLQAGYEHPNCNKDGKMD